MKRKISSSLGGDACVGSSLPKGLLVFVGFRLTLDMIIDQGWHFDFFWHCDDLPDRMGYEEFCSHQRSLVRFPMKSTCFVHFYFTHCILLLLFSFSDFQSWVLSIRIHSISQNSWNPLITKLPNDTWKWKAQDFPGTTACNCRKSANSSVTCSPAFVLKWIMGRGVANSMSSDCICVFPCLWHICNMSSHVFCVGKTEEWTHQRVNEKPGQRSWRKIAQILSAVHGAYVSSAQVAPTKRPKTCVD